MFPTSPLYPQKLDVSPNDPPKALLAGERVCARGGPQVARINFCKTRTGHQDVDDDDVDDSDNYDDGDDGHNWEGVGVG